ncbi:MAG: bifunctional glutamate N-acetyltransferase/amino-acid acetyltransferase ArgJ [Verrucomicrobiota bacterium]|nr:bifunctional glutamate N-acetyltransferase/amino-acid acetyltransferase ArgJ [Verrucomicrobiota bacterium]
MKSRFRKISGSIMAPKGFRAAAVFCDIKRLGTGTGSNKDKKGDLALIVSDVPAAVAGLFTTNQVAAPPVKLSAERVARGVAQAIVVNSGNANACTGARGLADAKEMTRVAARELGFREGDLLVGSTGRIGVLLPMTNVKRGIRAAARALRPGAANATRVAEAIMTSDTRRKEIAVEFKLDRKTVRIGGICKGAGMIHPMMRTPAGLHATMLSFITTDAAIAPVALNRALEIAVDQSFNRITVDGDMSTNDTVIALANGVAGNRQMTRPAPLFQDALNFVTRELAKMIVLDGEGASRFVTVVVHGARSAPDADSAARAIANSVLVKTSWCGGDPNWGRVLCAAGYSRARFDQTNVDIAYKSAALPAMRYALRNGQPTRTPLASLIEIVGAKEFEIHVFLHAGKRDAQMYASDLSEEYVSFNKGDLSDPKALGG